MFIGVDGYSKGWVVVSLHDAGQCEIDFLVRTEEKETEAFVELKRLFDAPFRRAMIDIPIGLPETGYRYCDLEGRELLRENRCRLFCGARRPLLSYERREAAHAWAKSIDNFGVSCQLFCLLPKIKQVDQLMSPGRQKRICETHPELIFQRLNGDSSLPSKKTHDGIQKRRNLLFDNGFSSIDDLLNRRLGRGAKPDDVLDACACALAAKFADRKRRLPKTQQKPDSKGLRMEMWY
jgi:predicted RNase H-like nuclease